MMNVPASNEQPAPTPALSSYSIPTNKIITLPEPGRGDPNDKDLDGLITSLKTIGLLHPITVVQDGDHYNLLAGARRLAAARALDWETIPAMQVHDVDATKQIAIAVLENLDRKQLTPWEEAINCAAAFEILGDIDKLADVIHHSPAWIAGRLQILQWPEDCHNALNQGLLSMSALSHLARISDPTQRTFYLEEAIKNGASATTAAAWARAALADPMGSVPDVPPSSSPDPGKNPARSMPGIPCFVCETTHPLTDLKHFPLCPGCLVLIRDFQNATLPTPPESDPQKHETPQPNEDPGAPGARRDPAAGSRHVQTPPIAALPTPERH